MALSIKLIGARMAKLWPFFLIACKRNGNKNKEIFDLDASSPPFTLVGCFRQWYHFNGNLMVSNNI